MKKTLILMAAAAISLSAAAQSSIFCSDDNHRFFGVRASLDISTPSDIKVDDAHTKLDALNPGAGFSIGAIYNLPVIANFYVEPGVSLYYHTSKVEKDLLKDNAGGINDYTGASLREFGLSIPVQLGYHFDFQPVRVNVFTGPVFNIGLKGRWHVSDKSGDIDMNGSTGAYGENGGLNRADVAWRFGAGVTLSERYVIALHGDVAMTNALHDTPGISMHRNQVAITLGYNF